MTEPLFDPEKVKRYNFLPTMGSVASPNGCIVKAGDYDKLLSLYRELLSTCEIAQRQLP